MPVSYLLFGPVLFQDFELPASITWGGAHSLAIHRLPGGARIIDAMGRDDADITWSGIFSGEDASFRARALDLMRAEGSVWPLTWDSFFYSGRPRNRARNRRPGRPAIHRQRLFCPRRPQRQPRLKEPSCAPSPPPAAPCSTSPPPN
jgi:hypothetical protein